MRVGLRLSVLSAWCSISASSSLAGGSELGRHQAPIIYGDDNRLEVYEVQDELLRERARRSTVAFILPRRLRESVQGSFAIEAPPVESVYGLCGGERFTGQPTAAWCSGVLIDDDLVLTAGHCLGDTPEEVDHRCGAMAAVFGYLYEDEDKLASIDADDIYRCRRVASWARTPRELEAPDYAIVQLDRAATPRQRVVPIRQRAVRSGERISLVGFGVGLPAKVEQGARVTDTEQYAEYFGAETDTFEGASGSPVFDDAAELVAVHTRGQFDWSFDDGCRASVRTDEGNEFHQRVQTPIVDLCESGWPSLRLCRTEPRCGDGVCSADESAAVASCLSDCPQPTCGDGLCEAMEPETCSADCNPYQSLPSGWICPEEFYLDQLGCDCDCGSRDPDCDDAGQLVFCAAGERCNSEGSCVGGGEDVVSSLDGQASDSGCSCRAGRGQPSTTAGLLLGLLAICRARRRRR